ncbi:hypothetical protein REPUB_Repub01dG0051100 [Reevesia pubescens]
MGVFQCTLDRVIEELKNYNDFAIHQLLLRYGITGGKGTLSDEHLMLSAKCQALAELVTKGGHRVLIFSQCTFMLDILEWTLDVIEITYRRLDGRVGGQGLNLTGADTVIIHDMDFNPQIDRQAEDRCHRIGQTKPITIYRLVTKGTIDENVYEIAKRKLTLDAPVLESGMVVDNEGDTSGKTVGEILSSLLMSYKNYKSMR